MRAKEIMLRSDTDLPPLVLGDLPLEDRPTCLDDHGPIFILGCPRSGTTFLSECISTIPGVAEFVGVLAPPRLMHYLGKKSKDFDASEIMSFVRDVFWQQFWRSVFARGERTKRWLQGKIGFGELIASPSLKGKLFCYKEPFLCYAVDEFSVFFPNSKFIHIVRDGRDNADSIERTYPHALSDAVLRDDLLSYNKNSEIGFWTKEKGFNFPWWVPKHEWDNFLAMNKYHRCVKMWAEMTRRALSLRETVSADRYLELRYEDLVSDPQRYGDKILSFLGANDSSKFRKKLGRSVSSSIKIAKKNQKPADIEKANQIAGDLLAKIGYEL